MDRRTFILGSAAAVVALHGAGADTRILSDDAIRAILRQRIDVDKRGTGMAVGIVDGKRRRMVTYGRQDVGVARGVARDTLFEIGSVTKVVTALLLAEMAHRGELGLEDPVDRYLPSGFRTPQRNGRAITLADLASHTSGLPYFPFDVRTTPNALDALARFTLEDFRAWLAGLTLSSDPGTRWEYSNAGYGLLGLALATRAGTTFEQLVERRIVRPLGLKDTTFHPTRDAAGRVAVGHDTRLAPVPPIELGLFAAAGSLRSTAEDMVRFLGAMLPGSGSPMELPARLLTTIRQPAPAAGGEQALGWDVVTTVAEPFLAKDGVTMGQTATAVLDPPRRTGIVVLSNGFPVKLQAPPGGGVGAADLARHLLRPELPLG